MNTRIEIPDGRLVFSKPPVVITNHNRGVALEPRLSSPGCTVFSTTSREELPTNEIERLTVEVSGVSHRFLNATVRYLEQGDVTGLLVEWRPDGVR